MKLKFLIPAVIICVFQLSCRKKKTCQDFSCESNFCLGNLTSEVIYYSIGSTLYTDSLMPGDVKCSSQGTVHKRHSRFNCDVLEEGNSVITVYSSTGDWFKKIDQCENRSNFEYDGTNINLYSAD